MTMVFVLALFCTLTLFAQNNSGGDNNTKNDQLEAWMDKISSDPGMCADMIALMVYKTKDNKESMMQLAEQFTRYPELNKMILEKMPRNAESQFTIQPKGISGNTKLIEMKPIEAMPKK